MFHLFMASEYYLVSFYTFTYLIFCINDNYTSHIENNDLITRSFPFDSGTENQFPVAESMHQP